MTVLSDDIDHQSIPSDSQYCYNAIEDSQSYLYFFIISEKTEAKFYGGVGVISHGVKLHNTLEASLNLNKAV